MLNISEVTAFYIDQKYTDEMKVLLLDAFSLMEAFQRTYYEDRYVNLINQVNTLAVDDVSSIFISYIQEDLNEIINVHGIKLSHEMDVTLSEMLEICHLLFLLANMEDYSFVSYRVNTEQPSRITFIDLVERYTLLSRARAMEIIESVQESLIETLRDVSNNALVEDTDPIDVKHKKYVNCFFEYIEDVPCLAQSLKDKGYEINNSLEELLNLLTFDIHDYVNKNSVTNLAQVSLDVLSLLIFTQDDYDMPVFKFKKNTHLFTSNSDLSLKLHNTIFAMVNDFSMFLEAYKEKEKINAH